MANLKNLSTKDLISASSRSGGIPPDQLMIKIMKGNNETRGTYVHPRLVPHVAMWASTDLAIQVSDIVNMHFLQKVTKEKDEMITTLNISIKENRANFKKLQANHEELKAELKDVKNQNVKLMEKMDLLRDDNKELYNHNKEVADTVSYFCDLSLDQTNEINNLTKKNK